MAQYYFIHPHPKRPLSNRRTTTTISCLEKPVCRLRDTGTMDQKIQPQLHNNATIAGDSNSWHPVSSPLLPPHPADQPVPFTPAQHPLFPSQMTDPQFEQSFPIPEEFLRMPTGSSVVEPDSVMASNGRLYHGYKEGQYFLPNDAPEQDRLDMQHMMVTLVLDGRLACAPMTKTPKVSTRHSSGVSWFPILTLP
jgi:hypothetical protein